jgi:hypothetical protein
MEETYDIFSGSNDGEPLWLEVVEGLEAARQRIKELANEKPGTYFLFDCSSQKVLVSIDTTGDGQLGSDHDDGKFAQTFLFVCSGCNSPVSISCVRGAKQLSPVGISFQLHCANCGLLFQATPADAVREYAEEWEY